MIIHDPPGVKVAGMCVGFKGLVGLGNPKLGFKLKTGQ